MYPGDNIISNPEMHYNRVKLINAPPSVVFPWMLQLGKERGGWYLPSSFERFIPTSKRASRQINPNWTALSVGDAVKDYGFKRGKDISIVAEIVPNRSLVYKSERYGTTFTWALIVDAKGNERSEVRLRFRGRIQRKGWSRAALVWIGGWLDWATTAPMLAGLKERAERERLE